MSESVNSSCGGTKQYLLSGFLLPAVLLYLEIVLRMAAEISFVSSSMGGTLLACLAYGLFFDIFCFLPKKETVSRWIIAILAELFTIWFLIAYFTYNSYQVFMGLKIICSETGNVVNGFSDALFSVLKNGWFVILLFHVPFALLIVFRKKISFSVPKRLIVLPILLVAAFLLGFSGYKVDTCTEEKLQNYTAQYKYDNAVHSFGVLTSLQLDLRYWIFGNKAEEEMTFVTDAAAASTSAEPDTREEQVKEQSSTTEGQTDVSTAEMEETTEEEPEIIDYGYNMLDIDFEALASETTNTKLANIHNYVASLTPSSKNQYTGLFEGKNLILICAESFSAEVIDPERTPTLYRLAHNGIYLEDFYQPTWGGSTSTGEYSFLTGIIPTSSSAMKDCIGHNMYFTMGNQLQREGYFSACYHDATATYYSRNYTHTNLGYSTFTTCDDGFKGKITVQWPYSDLEMMQLSLEDYIDNQPFSVYYMTVSGHPDFSADTNAMAKKNWSTVENLDYPKKVRGYLGAQQELENALAWLVEQLEEAGIADDTVICLCPDHFPYGLQQSSSWNNSEDLLHYLYGYSAFTNCMTRDHNAAIIWCGCLEDSDPICISEPTYSLDLVPTLSNLFGLDYDSRLLVGRDVLSDTEALVIFGDMSWKSSLGYYDHKKCTFTPNEGVEVEDGYVERINNQVANSFTYSRAYIQYDYFRVLFGEDEYQ